MEKVQTLQQMSLGKLDSCYTSIKSKWIQDLYIRLETLKLMKGTARDALEQQT
jgi:hypothetical protein